MIQTKRVNLTVVWLLLSVLVLGQLSSLQAQATEDVPAL